jgi:hypothetical protein
LNCLHELAVDGNLVAQQIVYVAILKGSCPMEQFLFSIYQAR